MIPENIANALLYFGLFMAIFSIFESMANQGKKWAMRLMFVGMIVFLIAFIYEALLFILTII
jgi:hypothetical protein